MLNMEARAELERRLLQVDLTNCRDLVIHSCGLLTELEVESECKDMRETHIKYLGALRRRLEFQFPEHRLVAFQGFDSGQRFAQAAADWKEALSKGVNKLSETSNRSGASAFVLAREDAMNMLNPVFDKFIEAFCDMKEDICAN